MRAADAAAAIQAYEEAVVHYDQVIDVLELDGRDDDERLARTWFLKASALLWSGHTRPALQALLRAANYVHRAGDAEQLVEIAAMLTLTSSCHPQQSHAGLLEQALRLLPDGDTAMRAKALGCLAFVMRSVGDLARARVLVRDAIDMADRAGDVDAQCFTLKMAIIALRSEPETVEQRIELGRRVLALALDLGHKEHAAEAHCWQALNLLEAGLIDEYARVLDGWESLNIGPYALHRSFLDAGQIALALLGGEWNGLEERIEALFEAARKTRQADAEGVYGAQMFAFNRDLGRLRDLEPLVRRIAGSGEKAWTPGLMLMCSELGLLDEARRQFERIAADEFAALVRDDMYVTCLVFCAETCCRLGDAERAALLYERLLPYAEQTANHPRAVCFGSAQLYLGMLARTTGQAEAARRHLAAAVERNRDMRAWPWLARAQFQYGALLADVDEDGAVSRRMLLEAEELADRLGMASLLDEIGLLLRGSVSRYPDDLTEREVDVLRLIAIGRSNKDISIVLSISLNTVATHVRRILNKTYCANRTEAAAYAMRNGLDGSAEAAKTTKKA
jgi:DNA-binding CsgD family transcriptional regulator